MGKQDSNLKVGNETPQQRREQEAHQRGDTRGQGPADAPDDFRHQNDREREQPEINRRQKDDVGKAPESGTER